jgi:hypothetical protein
MKVPVSGGAQGAAKPATRTQAAAQPKAAGRQKAAVQAATTTGGTGGAGGTSGTKGAVQPAAAKPAARHAAARHSTGSHAAARHAKAATSTKPFTIYDSVTPSAIPAGQRDAAYSNGAYAVSSSAVAGHGKVLWIDVNGSNTSADALDVEPGDATPAGAAAWASAKLTANPHSNAIIYTFQGDWSEVIANVDALPTWMHSHVKYWIADPTGVTHILPGAAATQWYWGPNYDISSAYQGFTS